MKKLFLAVAALFCAVSLHAQSNINVDLGQFKAINVSGNITVNLTQGESNKMTTTIDNSIVSMFTWELKDGELFLRLKGRVNVDGKKQQPFVTLNLTFKELDQITASVNSTVRADSVLNLDVVSIYAMDKANIVLDVAARDLTIDAQTGAVVTMKGTVAYIVIKSATNASVNTIQMDPLTVTATAATYGECYVRSSKKLQLKAIAGGNIFYKDEAEIINKEEKTFGHIEAF